MRSTRAACSAAFSGAALRPRSAAERARWLAQEALQEAIAQQVNVQSDPQRQHQVTFGTVQSSELPATRSRHDESKAGPDSKRSPERTEDSGLNANPTVARSHRLGSARGMIPEPAPPCIQQLPGSLWLHQAPRRRHQLDQCTPLVRGRSAGTGGAASAEAWGRSHAHADVRAQAQHCVLLEGRVADASPGSGGGSMCSWSEGDGEHDAGEPHLVAGPDNWSHLAAPLPQDQEAWRTAHFLRRGDGATSCFDLPAVTHLRSEQRAARAAVARAVLATNAGDEHSCSGAPFDGGTVGGASAGAQARTLAQLHALAQAEGLLERGEPPTPVAPSRAGLGACAQRGSYLVASPARSKKSLRRSGRRKSSRGGAAAAESASALAIWMADASSDASGDSRHGDMEPPPHSALQACIKRAAAREEAEFTKLACKVLEKLDADVVVSGCFMCLFGCVACV